MPVKTKPKPSASETAEISLLKKAFEQFTQNSKKLADAYRKMQEDFQRLNVELDEKNEELENTLRETRTNRERLNSILQSLQSGVIVIDTNGTVTQFNRAAEIIGCKEKDAVGRPYGEVAPHGKTEYGLLDTLKNRKEIRHEEKLLTAKNGTLVPVNYSTSLILDENGEPNGAVEVFHDISKIKEMEQEVIQTRTLAALGEMSATVAHEIRNPLGGIGTYTALLERDLERDDPRRELVRNILQGIARLNKIVTNLLVYTRPMRANFRNVDLNELVEEVTNFAALEIGQRHGDNIEIDSNLPKRNLFSKADPEKMQQLLLNLFFNAAQAVNKKGKIIIKLNRINKLPEEIKTTRKNSWNRISIRDTGPGIPTEKIKQIFNPFFTTREDGTGLGLAIVQKITDVHGGIIRVKSKTNHGANFELYLPAM